MSLPLTTSQIAKLLVCPEANVTEHWPAIENCLKAVGIWTDDVAIAALATIRVECPPFRPVKEYGTDQYHEQMYGGRKDLGNLEPGDGARYCGRGFIQITGKVNYEHYGRELGIDLIARPEAALESNTAAMIFALYFKERKVDVAANHHDWAKVRRLVNGGLNGFGLFMEYVRKLQGALAPYVAPDVTGERSM